MNKEEIIENMNQCCGGGHHRKYERIFMVLGGFVLLMLIALSVAAVGFKLHAEKRVSLGNNSFEHGRVGNADKGNYQMSVPPTADNQFALPQDAAKSGEIAMVVNNLEAAKKAVTEVATKGNGNVYATFISYTSSSSKNGSMVVRVPMENFEMAFGDLKKVGTQVVQESTLQIAPTNFYPMPMAVETQSIDNQALQNQTVIDSSATSVSNPEMAIYQNPLPAQFAQDKGYIRVVFVDYGNETSRGGGMIQGKNVAGNVVGIGNFVNQEVRDNSIVIIGVKLIFLVAIFGLLIIVFKKLFQRMRRRLEHRRGVHVVRQMPKTHRQVVKIQKRK
ncbi:MAG: DUF4349 domain-containing protein [Candidatus Moranbacteria bacterium]|nr:DUF4349 domain-containing protein [Candidatus Moranbacteria bacterium]